MTSSTQEEETEDEQKKTTPESMPPDLTDTASLLPEALQISILHHRSNLWKDPAWNITCPK